MIRRECVAAVASILTVGSLVALAAQDQAQLRQRSLAAVTAARDIGVRPEALTDFPEELGGLRVRLPESRVVEVLGPTALIVQPIGKWSKTVPWTDRLLVLIQHGTLRTDSEWLADSSVRVRGVARTPLGIQLTREVPWPQRLTKERAAKQGVRTVILATSVQTLDGVELTNQRFPDQPPRRP